MAFVVDASMTTAWCFEDQMDGSAERALDLLRRDRAHVPGIWPLEVANVLAVGERRGRLTPAQSARFAELLLSLPIHVEPLDVARTWSTLLDLARRHALSAYDAAYLELAARLGVPLACSDDRLRRAAQTAGVTVLE